LNSAKVVGHCHQKEYETEWSNIINIYNIIYLKEKTHNFKQFVC